MCREKTLAICLLMTPLSSAANMRSLHSEASTHNRYRSFVSAPCLTLTGTTGATLCSRRGSHASTFLSPFPQHDFAFRAFRGSTRNGTMETLTPAALTYDAGLPTYLATSSCRSASNHVGCLVTAYHHASVTSDFRTSPCMSRLVAAPPPNRVRLPTDRQFALGCSPPCFAATQLPSATELWLSPAWTFTMLLWRLHGRTHTGESRYPDSLKFLDSGSPPAFAGVARMTTEFCCEFWDRT